MKFINASKRKNLVKPKLGVELKRDGSIFVLKANKAPHCSNWIKGAKSTGGVEYVLVQKRNISYEVIKPVAEVDKRSHGGFFCEPSVTGEMIPRVDEELLKAWIVKRCFVGDESLEAIAAIERNIEQDAQDNNDFYTQMLDDMKKGIW